MEHYIREPLNSINRPLLSIVIPAYNEELSIGKTIPSIVKVIVSSRQFLESPYKFEIIVVDDGSTDSTSKEVRNLGKSYPNLRLVQLLKNSGHMIALEIGLTQSRGQFVCSIDADLQDPPGAIPQMLQMAESGNYDVIQAVRPDRKSDSWFKRSSAGLFYKVIKKLTGINVVPHAADFRLLTRAAVDSLLALPEKGKVFRLLIPYYGYRTKLLVVTRDKRIAGNSKYPLKKMLSLSLDSVVRFSSKPLRAVSLVGLASSLFLIFGAVTTTILWFTTDVVAGWTSITLIILASNSMILCGLGIIAEYLGRTYENSLKRNTSLFIEAHLYGDEKN
jgi:dolichol-phosphate mannosyltransferase